MQSPKQMSISEDKCWLVNVAAILAEMLTVAGVTARNPLLAQMDAPGMPLSMFIATERLIGDNLHALLIGPWERTIAPSKPAITSVDGGWSNLSPKDSYNYYCSYDLWAVNQTLLFMTVWNIFSSKHVIAEILSSGAMERNMLQGFWMSQRFHRIDRKPNKVTWLGDRASHCGKWWFCIESVHRWSEQSIYKLLSGLHARWESLLCTTVYIRTVREEGAANPFLHTAERYVAGKEVDSHDQTRCQTQLSAWYLYVLATFHIRLVLSGTDGKGARLKKDAVPHVFTWMADDKDSASSRCKILSYRTIRKSAVQLTPPPHTYLEFFESELQVAQQQVVDLQQQLKGVDAMVTQITQDFQMVKLLMFCGSI